MIPFGYIVRVVNGKNQSYNNRIGLGYLVTRILSIKNLKDIVLHNTQ